jgi:poly(3-hydroxybutyrate) depolymerase
VRALGVSLFLIATASLAACSSTSIGTHGEYSAAETSGNSAPGATGDAREDDHAEPLVVDRATACPARYVDHAPVAGDNAGFTAAGQSRKFHLLLPPSSFSGPRPILFAFHGTSENGSRFVTRAKLADFAARGFVVVAPDAVGNGGIWPVWDAMRTPQAESLPNADVELFDRLLGCVAGHFSIDQRRVFAAGHSAGGIFTNRLLRARSSVLAGGIVASGVFDLTSARGSAPLDPLLAIVTWGGDNDSYRGSTPSGVTVPAFSFVEQASLASKFYDAQPDATHVRCRGNELGHAWLPLNDWFIGLMLSRPKGSSASTFALPSLPAGARAACTTDPYDVAPLPNMTCPSTTPARRGCTEACQLFADCAVENRTVGPSLSTELGAIGFTTSSCDGCVQRCQAGATTSADAAALSCFAEKQATAVCGPGIEGASPLFQTVNECCKNRAGSNLCVQMCTALNANSVAKGFFPTCQQIAP